jgi:hypothetical protein
LHNVFFTLRSEQLTADVRDRVDVLHDK